MELIHGGDWAGQEERLGNRSIRDFSANVSPLGVPDGVREAICRAAGKIDRYPDPLCRKLIQKLSEELSCPEEWIVCGNGAADLIYRLFLCHNNPLTLKIIKLINFLLCKEYQILQTFNREK